MPSAIGKAVLLSVTGIAAAMSAGAGAQALDWRSSLSEPMEATVRTGNAERRMLIASPGAARSLAIRIDEIGAKAPAMFNMTPLDEVMMHALVVAKANEASLAGLAFERVDGIAGFYTISTPSVDDAIRLADRLSGTKGVAAASVATSRAFATRALPNDPAIPLAWHLQNTQQLGHDINAEAAWDMGYTGQGVRVGILDEGVAITHEDLSPNHVVALSQPGLPSSGHGTSVAGVAIARGDNSAGSAGLAYNATFGHQRFYLGFDVTSDIGPLTNAAAITHANDLIDVRNNSWGPLDNQAYHALDPIELAAIETVITEGRDGKGGILVWAAGNGSILDRVEYDGFAGSRYSIAIGAIGHLATRAVYNERGSAMMAVTYSSGNFDPDTNLQRNIYTTFNTSNSSYSGSFGGTSAAAPLATGAVALALEANPSMTWRDMQHLVVDTAQPVDNADPLWVTNGAGHDFNDNYGFGQLDAAEMIGAALSWQPVGPYVSTDSGVIAVNQPVPDGDQITGLSLSIPVAPQIRIEHVELRLRMQGTYIGDIAVELESPAGTVSTLATYRNNGRDDMDHLFTSFKHWDEASAGTWTVRISDGFAGDAHTWQDAQLIIHGTCMADQDASGSIDTDDFNAWLANYQSQNGLADTNGDGQILPTDFNAFLVAWRLGC